MVTKLYNVARFCAPFLPDEGNQTDTAPPFLSTADKWILSKMHLCIHNVTESMLNYDYAAAKNEVEVFFWHDLADNYIEMAKLRIYNDNEDVMMGPVYTLDVVLRNILLLLAPFLPYITERLYQTLYAARCRHDSIHKASWPEPDPAMMKTQESAWGDELVTVATMVRRYKSDHTLPLGYKLSKLRISSTDHDLLDYLRSAKPDLMSVTRANELEFYHLPEDEFDKQKKLTISVEM